MSKSFLEEYNNYSGVKTVSSNGVNAYFIKYGEYNSLEELEKNTLSLPNYIYTENENLYSVYIGITMNQDNLTKLINYYKKLGYKVTSEELIITKKGFINYLTNADKLLENTKDETVLGEVSSQILSKYEELVISDS